MQIRPETASDRESVHSVNSAAFEGKAEADLVDALRSSGEPLISLVAVQTEGSEGRERVVGHILFSPVTLPRHPSSRVGPQARSVDPRSSSDSGSALASPKRGSPAAARSRFPSSWFSATPSPRFDS